MPKFASWKSGLVRREVVSTPIDERRVEVTSLPPHCEMLAVSGTGTRHVEMQSPVTPAGSSGVYGVVHGGDMPVSRAGAQEWQVGTTCYSLSVSALETGATIYLRPAVATLASPSETSQFKPSPGATPAGGMNPLTVLAILEKPAPLESATSPTRGAAVTASSNRSRRSCI